MSCCLIGKALVFGTKDCKLEACKVYCQSFAEKEKDKEKAPRTYEVRVCNMPARIGAEERTGRHASLALP